MPKLKSPARTWQEWVFFGGNLINFVAIMGTAVALVALPVVTTLPTALSLLGFTAAFASMRMWISALSVGACTLVWAFLLALSLGA